MTIVANTSSRLFEGMSLRRKHFLSRARPSGFISESADKKVVRKREEDLQAYEHGLKRVENEEEK